MGFTGPSTDWLTNALLRPLGLSTTICKAGLSLMKEMPENQETVLCGNGL